MKNDNDMRSMLKNAGVLFAITLVAGLLLGFVYELTKEPIRIQQEKAIQEACQNVFAEAEEFVVLDMSINSQLEEELALEKVKVGTIYQAAGKNGENMGYVLQVTSGEGYGGNITLYMGVTLEGNLNGISLLEISETPGLGMQAEDILVPQFSNKQVTSFTFTKVGSKADSEVDAISGATVTTKAIVDAVNGGLRVVTEELTKGGTTE